jgi:hypothetical protein
MDILKEGKKGLKEEEEKKEDEIRLIIGKCVTSF